MEYIKEDQILLDETVCSEYANEDAKLRYEWTKRFKENIRLVPHIASKYIYYANSASAYDIDDILQVGYIGLWKACIDFNPELGYEFSTYAYPNIKGYIARFVRDNSLNVHVPRWFKDFKFTLYQHGFELPLNKEEIDILLSEGVFTYNQIMTYVAINVTSLDTPMELKDNSSVDLVDMIKDPSPDIQSLYTDEEIEALISDIIKLLPEKYRDVAEEWMYSILAGDEITQRELSKKYKKSQANISRILVKCRKIIKNNYKKVYKLFGI